MLLRVQRETKRPPPRPNSTTPLPPPPAPLPPPQVSSFDKWLKVFAAKGIKCKILTAHYPLAPEHPYPAGREAVEDVITWLFEKSGEVGPFIIGG
jgi:hypothetical protein